MLRYLFPLRLRQWLGPFLVAGIAAAALGILVVSSGWLNLTATTPHPDGWARFLHFVFQRSTAHHAAGIAVPADLDSPVRVAAGAIYYGDACAHCHGAPGFGQNQVALSMTPKPQYLPHTTKTFTPSELFWIVRHGVKYSAMPGWPAETRDDEVWHLVSYLRAQQHMTPDQFRALAKLTPQTAPITHPFGATPSEHFYWMHDAKAPLAGEHNYARPTYGFNAFAMTSEPTQTCARCHGADGGGGGVFPNLATQDRTYLRDSLYAFARGTRRSAYMQLIAAQLSPQQIDALSSYYAGQPKRRADPSPVAATPLGQQWALTGVATRGLGPCAGCHGVTKAAGKSAPRLEGQSFWYLANQMRLFANGGRGSAALGANPMLAIAKKLNAGEIDAVSAYYAAQPPAAVQSFAAKP